MSASGALIAALDAHMLSVVAGSLTFYLVTTAFLSVRRMRGYERLSIVQPMIFGVMVGSLGLSIGIRSLLAGIMQIDGHPIQVCIAFGSIALLGAMGDMRTLFLERLTGKQKLIRHI